MPEFLSAGVFIEEVASGESAVLGDSTSNFATVGWTPRGKEDEAVLVTSLPDYFRKFGQYWSKSDTPLAVTAFFKNSGARMYFVRVTPDDALAALGSIGAYWDGSAISKGAWGNLLRLKIVGNENFKNVATATYSRFNVEIQEESLDGLGDYVTLETFEALSLDDDEDADYILDVINDDDNGSDFARLVAGASAGIPADFVSTPIVGEAIGTGDGSTPAFASTLVAPPVAPFTVKVYVDGIEQAVDNGRGVLQASPSISGFSSVSGTIDYDTGELLVGFTPAPLGSAPIVADYYTAGVDEVSVELVGGADGTAITRSNVTDPALELNSRGLYAFNQVEEILNIGLADFRGDEIVHGDLIAYCENRKDCFAILDTPKNLDAVGAKNYKQVTLASLSEYAAIYHPGIQIANPLKNGKLKTISPVGHIAGVYARTDNNRNVGKAPAGVNEGALQFAVKLEAVLSKGERDVIYPANVNPLISSIPTGRAVWGARNLAVTGDYTLVQVRRLFMFLEKSVFNSTHDLVFEPIGTDLFSLVKLRLDSFLGALTQDGYFASRLPSEAFKTIVDSSNNTNATLTSRQLIVDILVAPQTPAEFVRMRFQRVFGSL